FQFGFEEEVLVPRSLTFGCAELGQADAVEIGRTDTHVALRVGPWTIFLKIDKDGRYPDFESIIPRPNATTTTCRFDRGDIEFLLRSMPRLPGKEELNRPMTLDL